jgi:hypothetical protein
MIAESFTAFGLIIDRLIQLVERQEKVSRNTFTDFVAPVMTDFDAVHQDYLDSFNRYAELLQDTTHPFDLNHPIFNAIERDRVMSRHLRGRARVLRASAADNHVFKKLAGSIEEYFGEQVPWVSTGQLQPGRSGRTVLANALKSLAQSENIGLPPHELALSALENTTYDLQTCYSQVLDDFQELKENLLKPR